MIKVRIRVMVDLLCPRTKAFEFEIIVGIVPIVWVLKTVHNGLC